MVEVRENEGLETVARLRNWNCPDVSRSVVVSTQNVRQKKLRLNVATYVINHLNGKVQSQTKSGKIGWIH